MFEEMRAAVNAAENVVNQLGYRKSSLVETLDTYNQRATGVTDWEEIERKQTAIELDLINEVEKYIMKWVKSQF